MQSDIYFKARIRMSVALKTFYITSPIYYVNDVAHIGHTSTNLICDIIARFKRLDGYQVKFLTGTDEHGQKIEKSALKAGISPQEFTDKVSQTFVNLNQVMNFSNDDFIRTTEERHKKTVIKVWNKLLASGNIYLGKYAGWYAVRDEAFYTESELVDGKAPTGAEVEWVEESSYFFKLSAWQDKLIEFYENNPGFIMPESRRNEVLSFVKSGLNDLSVSRTSLTWGIKVPGEEKHVIYVWLDALFNYYSAIDNDADKKFWPCDLHVIGKDILRFHAVYWPAFLMAAELELPKCIFAHAWWTNNTEKISKSLGNVIDPIQLVEEFGLDYVRYFLAREMPYGNDKDYSREIFINRINSDLCNNIGNLVQRVLSFVNKYCGGKIPTPNLDANDKQLLTVAYAALNEVRGFVENAQIGLAVDSIIKVSSRANEYIDTQAPWSLRKTDTKRMETVLYTLMEVIRVIGILLQPFIPNAAEKILDMLAVEGYNFICLNADTALQPGVSLPAPNIVFPKIEG